MPFETTTHWRSGSAIITRTLPGRVLRALHEELAVRLEHEHDGLRTRPFSMMMLIRVPSRRSSTISPAIAWLALSTVARSRASLAGVGRAAERRRAGRRRGGRKTRRAQTVRRAQIGDLAVGAPYHRRRCNAFSTYSFAKSGLLSACQKRAATSAASASMFT
jgi:hypothetical protein